ncbi:MAG TPA: FtsX-like permease family protein [Gemmatimonadales bacterium]
MTGALAAAALLRHRGRTLLAVLGVAVASAMLLDMVMLSTGMRESFSGLLDESGFQLRVTPRGTIPFDSEATIGGASEIARLLHSNPDVETVSPVLGAALHLTVAEGGEATTAVGLGVDPAVQGDYELVSGSNATRPDRMVANDVLLERAGVRVGDTIAVATGYDPQLRSHTGRRLLVVTGRARFRYLAADQAAAALPLATLQAMGGATQADRVSLFMVRVRDGADAERVSRWVAARVPRVTTLSTASALAMMEERLSYFRQLALILGAVSLTVGFLLVTTLVTVSVNERIGEIAVLRAIGVSRLNVVRQVVLESLAISASGAVLGLGLGLVTGRWLNSILRAFPGLPAGIDFFPFQPLAAFQALGMLVAAGVMAAVYPSWRAASLPVAVTLRGEAVA